MIARSSSHAPRYDFARASLAREAGALGQRYFLRELAFDGRNQGRRAGLGERRRSRGRGAHTPTRWRRHSPATPMLGEEGGGDARRRMRGWSTRSTARSTSCTACATGACRSRSPSPASAASASIYDPSLDELFSRRPRRRRAQQRRARCACRAARPARLRAGVQSATSTRHDARRAPAIAKRLLSRSGRRGEGHGRGRADAGARRRRTLRRVLEPHMHAVGRTGRSAADRRGRRPRRCAYPGAGGLPSGGRGARRGAGHFRRAGARCVQRAGATG